MLSLQQNDNENLPQLICFSIYSYKNFNMHVIHHISQGTSIYQYVIITSTFFYYLCEFGGKKPL